MKILALRRLWEIYRIAIYPPAPKPLLRADRRGINYKAMIDPFELRLKNWIFLKGIPAQVWAIHQNDLQLMNDIGIDMHRNNGDCQPIPLTPEILQKCSGQYSVLYFQPDYKNELISMGIDELEIIIRVDKPSQTLQGGVQVRPARWSKEVPWIQYLHQLQNLFYCLTGQELEIKF